ncbi:MAG: CPBP family intramembrane metalloprotease [Phycisphaeraceae bacterium]|nr:MAG: CPBP family intramembrane metalloprotease [Phycisphaeraceae bacterium]
MGSILDPLRHLVTPLRHLIGTFQPSLRQSSLLLALLFITLTPSPASAQDLPPAPPPPAEQAPRAETPPPPREQPREQPQPRPTQQPREQSSPSGDSDSFKLPDVTGWTVSDAVEYAENNRVVVVAIVAATVFVFLWIGNIVGPGSTPKLAGRDVKPLPAPIWLFGAILVFIAAPLAAQFLKELPQVNSGSDLRERALTQAGGVAAGIIAGMALLFVMSRTAPKAGLKIKFSDIPFGIGAFLLALPFVILAGDAAVALYRELYKESPSPIAHPTLELILANKSSQWAILLAITAVIGSPLLEEILYRGFLQSALLRFLNGQVWLAIIGSAALFTLVHRLGQPPVPWHALLPIFVLGLSMGIAYERTKRLGVPIAMHICFNAMNVALAWSGNT